MRTNPFVKLFLPILAFCCVAIPGSTQQRANQRRITQDIDETQLLRLQGNVHPLARAEFDAGAVPDSQPVTHMLLLLQRSSQQEEALHRLLDEQQRAGSAHYHAWLTPEQFGKHFGPSDADIQTVTDWLTKHGFSVGKISPGRTVIDFSGNVAQVRSAFHTDMHRFAVNDKEHFANISDPQIPVALQPVVSGVVSLHNFRKKPFLHHIGKFRRNSKTGEVQPLFTFSDVNGQFYAMGPADFAKIYNIPATCGGAPCDGAGQKIAIVGRSNINIKDVQDFRSIFGLPANDPQIVLNGPDPGLVSGDEGESDLDVEWAGAVAPAATILFVTTESTQTDALDGVDSSAQYIVDNNLAGVLSISYGQCENSLGTAGNAFENALWQQAAAQGITVVVAAGDNGAAGCDNPNSVTASTHGVGVSGTASTPYNVAIGGTDFDQAGIQSQFWSTTNTSTTSPVPASALGYIPEIPWNDSCAAAGLTGCNNAANSAANIVAGSGGPSTVYTTKPSWQTGLGDTARDVPDVSLFASDGQNQSFYIVCQSDADIAGDTGCSLSKFVGAPPFHDFQAIGGTSAGAPTFAGIMALVNQKTGQRQGNANYALYAMAKKPGATCASSASEASTCVFNDITKGNIAVRCAGASAGCSNTASGGFGVLTSSGKIAFDAGPGYDLATGLGSVNVANLIANWAAPTTIGTINTLSAPASPLNITVDSSVTFTGTVTKTSGSGTPSGYVVLENTSTNPPQPIDKAALSPTGAYSIATTLLQGGGPYNVVAHYGGDGVFAPSNSASVMVTAAKQNSNVVVGFVTSTGTITTAATTVEYGSPYLLRIDVKNGSSQACQNPSTGAIAFTCPTGKITLLDGGAALNDFPTTVNAPSANPPNVAFLNNRGFAEDQLIQLAAGAHSITATYPGDNSYNAGISNTLALTISKATTSLTVSSNLSTVSVGGTVTLTALVASTSNSSLGPSGTVQFKNGGTTLSAPATCTPTAFNPATNVGASCTATLTTTLSALYPLTMPGPSVPKIPGVLPLSSLVAMLTILLLIRSSRLSRRHAYAYLAFLGLVLAAGITGCSSMNSGGSGGGGGGGNRTITASYTGDSNYAASTGSTGITVH